MSILEEANRTKGDITDIVLKKYGLKGIGSPNLEMLQKFSDTNSPVVFNLNGDLQKQMKLTNYKLDTLINVMDDNNFITENTNKILKKDSDIYANEVRNRRVAKIS